MALFGKKKKDETDADGTASAGDVAGRGTGTDDGSDSESGEEPRLSPENARKFFDHASAMLDTSQFEYSMTCWLQGLGQDPSSMDGLEGFFKAAAGFLGSGKKKVSKETVKAIDGRGQISAYLKALLSWGIEPDSARSAVAATVAAAKFGLKDPSLWMGERALQLAAREKKPQKRHFERLQKVFEKFESFDLAVQAGELAVKADPTDSQLAARVRNLSAQAAMSRGHYDDMEEGGFRKNIKDADEQRRLEEGGRVVQTGDVRDRNVSAARAEYESRPNDKPTIRKYATALFDRAREDDVQTALTLLDQTFESTQEFQFKAMADEQRVKQARDIARSAKQALEANPKDADARAAFETAAKEYSNLEIGALEAQVNAYPTDLGRKFDLGKAYFRAKRFEDAIGMFQQAKADAKRRSDVLDNLARAFQQIAWHDAAIETYREALESHDEPDNALGKSLRYGLMVSLQDHADESDDFEAAEEAFKIASNIARSDFNYRDIRDRRTTLKALVDRLKT